MGSKQTGSGIASTASKILQDGRYGSTAKSLAASVLSQTGNGKATSSKMATLASQVLQNDQASNAAQSVAASALAQAKGD